MTADLSALIARLEAAEAGSREMDGEIALAFGYPRDVWGDAFDRPLAVDGPAFHNDAATWSGEGKSWSAPTFTASLDAALALAERVLGTDQEYEITTLYNIARVTLNMNHGDESGPFYGSNDCCVVPLAICAATLRAKLDGCEVNKNPKAQEG